jgi:hypothetical protein
MSARRDVPRGLARVCPRSRGPAVAEVGGRGLQVHRILNHAGLFDEIARCAKTSTRSRELVGSGESARNEVIVLGARDRAFSRRPSYSCEACRIGEFGLSHEA